VTDDLDGSPPGTTATIAESPAPGIPAGGNGGPRRARHRPLGPDPVAQPDVPTAVTGHYLPALDGLRAVSMIGVLIYHLNASWLPGGYLGVDMFFVLSGFLITSLLLEEWARKGGLTLSLFWARRARRLLPALFLALGLLMLFVVLDDRFGGGLIDLSGVRGDAISTLFYVANWHLAFTHQSYFAVGASPLEHTWSLAIEEQFYLVWPPILLGLLVWGGGHWRRIGLAFCVVGGLGSALAMALLYHPGVDPTRVYFGTDTRAFDLLAGIAVAMVVAARPQPRRRFQRQWHVLGLAAALGVGVFWATAPTLHGLPGGFMFRGGFFVCAVLMALVIADARLLHPGPLGRLLSVGPLRWFGMITYGFYLFHWPVIVYLNPARTGLSGATLDLARVALTMVLAVASFYLVERPLRRMRISGWPRFVVAPVAALGVAVAVVVATLPAVASPVTTVSKASVATVTSGAAIPGAGGFSKEKPIALAPGRVPSPADPLRVMVMGDSVMFVAAPGISASLQATGAVTVAQRAIVGWGLTTDPGWRQSVAGAIADVHPEIVLAMWSWDDTLAQTDPSAYRRLLEQYINLVLTPGDGVDGLVFTEFPRTGPAIGSADVAAATATRDAGQVAWDRIVRSMTTVYPGRVMYLPVAASVVPHGHFVTWLAPAGDPSAPKSAWVRVRMADNVHMCPGGVVRYAQAVTADLQTLFHVPAPVAGWNEGPWINDPRYETPPGQCPDDHPPT